MALRHAAFLLLVLPLRLDGQGAVLEARSGRYEVIGLRRWTLTQLQDSLAAHDASLTSHTCAAVLRNTLGFPDVSVVLYPAGEAGRPTKFFEIMVLEPQDSGRAQFLPMPADSLPVRDSWADLALPFQHNNNLWGFLMAYPEALYSRIPIDSLLKRSSDTEHLRTAMASLPLAQLADTALYTLETDHNPSNVFPALLILGSPESGTAGLAALARILRSPHNFISLSAAHLLHSRITAERGVNWTPLVPSIRAVLDGTNLFAVGPVIRILRQTHPPRPMSDKLVVGGGRVLLARLAAADSVIRTEAHELLQTLTGDSLPPDPALWATRLGVSLH
jgi:hypothetical protein